MFTGIIESEGTVQKVTVSGSNKTFWIRSPISSKLRKDQSVSHDGVCLTVEETRKGRHRVTAVAETLKKSTLDSWQVGHSVNLERCLRMKDRLDGHFVQGHVDTVATCTGKADREGSHEFRISFPGVFKDLLIEKGSVSINGISLTAYNVSDTDFDVAIIPYTFEHTNLKELMPGQPVNVEFDMLGKYIRRILTQEKDKNQ